MSGMSASASIGFSYAQAAKGRSPTTNSTQGPITVDGTVASQNLDGKETKPITTTGRPRSSMKNMQSRSDDTTIENATEKMSLKGQEVEQGSEATEKENLVPSSIPNSTVESINRVNQCSEETVMRNNPPPPNSESDHDLPQAHAGNIENWDRDSHNSASADKTSQVDKEKAKEIDDDWEKVSIPSGTVEKELRAAPIPTVNIWHQRLEAQEAKLRENVSTRQPNGAVHALTTKATTNGDGPKRRLDLKDAQAQDREGALPSRKQAEFVKGDRKEPVPSQSSKPAHQQSETSQATSPPMVGDNESWPTPETSIVDEKKRSTTQERIDKNDAKSGQKSHAKQWISVPFVPTAKFETQLPPAAARRGGRGSHRGRDGTGRGGHAPPNNNANDKSETAHPVTAPANKTNLEQDRGRKPTGARGGRASSLPSSGHRNNSTEASAPRKLSANATRETSTSASNIGSNANAQSKVAVSAADDTKAVETVFPSSPHDATPAEYLVNGEEMRASSEQNPRNPQSLHVESESKYGGQPDRHRGHPHAQRGNGDSGRERGGYRPREWTREKAESTREKVESWRDREGSGEQQSRRESRSDRGRGGYRGRANHSTYNSQLSHAYTSPLPQNGFEPAKPASFNEGRSRHPSQNFTIPPASNASRVNARSQSIPNAAYSNFYGGVPGIPQTMSTLQPEMPNYGFPQVPVQQSMVNVLPYDPLGSYAILSMVMSQLEYYFSIDNLCKDLFLRKNMDSQGFVPLKVIANFKRMRALTEDNMASDTLRYVCHQVKSVEIIQTVDGEDRVRRREGWKDFVLPMEDRLETARHNGVANLHPSSRKPSNFDRSRQAEASDTIDSVKNIPSTSTPNGGSAIYNGYPEIENSAISHHAPLIASSTPHLNNATAPFVNGQPRSSLRSVEEENIFPDEQIHDISVIVRYLDSSTPANNSAPISQSTANNAENVSAGASSNRPVFGTTHSGNLRGGAGSPSELDQQRTFSPVNLNKFPQAMPYEGLSLVWTKDGESVPIHHQPDHVHHTYHELHDLAMQQRDTGNIKGREMEMLYTFWASFLVRDFNIGMYEEFKILAQNDSQNGSQLGMDHLLNYFDNVLLGKNVISERIANDLVNFARVESGDQRPVFQKLRSAWRNGATNLKTRKRIGDILTAEEKMDFDRGG